MRVLITGGCGFIGSALVRLIVRATDFAVVNLDRLTYAAEPRALAECAEDPRYQLIVGDVGDYELVRDLFTRFRPTAVVHLAAETHVDRSIDHLSLSCARTCLAPGACSRQPATTGKD